MLLPQDQRQIDALTRKPRSPMVAQADIDIEPIEMPERTPVRMPGPGRPLVRGGKPTPNFEDIVTPMPEDVLSATFYNKREFDKMLQGYLRRKPTETTIGEREGIDIPKDVGQQLSDPLGLGKGLVRGGAAVGAGIIGSIAYPILPARATWDPKKSALENYSAQWSKSIYEGREGDDTGAFLLREGAVGRVGVTNLAADVFHTIWEIGEGLGHIGWEAMELFTGEGREDAADFIANFSHYHYAQLPLARAITTLIHGDTDAVNKMMDYYAQTTADATSVRGISQEMQRDTRQWTRTYSRKDYTETEIRKVVETLKKQYDQIKLTDNDTAFQQAIAESLFEVYTDADALFKETTQRPVGVLLDLIDIWEITKIPQGAGRVGRGMKGMPDKVKQVMRRWQDNIADNAEKKRALQTKVDRLIAEGKLQPSAYKRLEEIGTQITERAKGEIQRGIEDIRYLLDPPDDSGGMAAATADGGSLTDLLGITDEAPEPDLTGSENLIPEADARPSTFAERRRSEGGIRVLNPNRDRRAEELREDGILTEDGLEHFIDEFRDADPNDSFQNERILNISQYLYEEVERRGHPLNAEELQEWIELEHPLTATHEAYTQHRIQRIGPERIEQVRRESAAELAQQQQDTYRQIIEDIRWNRNTSFTDEAIQLIEAAFSDRHLTRHEGEALEYIDGLGRTGRGTATEVRMALQQSGIEIPEIDPSERRTPFTVHEASDETMLEDTGGEDPPTISSRDFQAEYYQQFHDVGLEQALEEAQADGDTQRVAAIQAEFHRRGVTPGDANTRIRRVDSESLEMYRHELDSPFTRAEIDAEIQRRSSATSAQHEQIDTIARAFTDQWDLTPTQSDAVYQHIIEILGNPETSFLPQSEFINIQGGVIDFIVSQLNDRYPDVETLLAAASRDQFFPEESARVEDAPQVLPEPQTVRRFPADAEEGLDDVSHNIEAILQRNAGTESFTRGEGMPSRLENLNNELETEIGGLNDAALTQAFHEFSRENVRGNLDRSLVRTIIRNEFGRRNLSLPDEATATTTPDIHDRLDEQVMRGRGEQTQPTRTRENFFDDLLVSPEEARAAAQRDATPQRTSQDWTENELAHEQNIQAALDDLEAENYEEREGSDVAWRGFTLQVEDYISDIIEERTGSSYLNQPREFRENLMAELTSGTTIEDMRIGGILETIQPILDRAIENIADRSMTRAFQRGMSRNREIVERIRNMSDEEVAEAYLEDTSPNLIGNPERQPSIVAARAELERRGLPIPERALLENHETEELQALHRQLRARRRDLQRYSPGSNPHTAAQNDVERLQGEIRYFNDLMETRRQERGDPQNQSMEQLARQDPTQIDLANLSPQQIEELAEIASRDNNEALYAALNEDLQRRIAQHERTEGQRRSGIPGIDRMLEGQERIDNQFNAIANRYPDIPEDILALIRHRYSQNPARFNPIQAAADIQEQFPQLRGQDVEISILEYLRDLIQENPLGQRRQRQQGQSSQQETRPDVLTSEGGSSRARAGFDTAEGETAARRGMAATNEFDDAETYPTPDSIMAALDSVYTELEALTPADVERKMQLERRLAQAQEALRRRIPSRGRGTRLNMGIDPSQLGEDARKIWNKLRSALSKLDLPKPQIRNVRFIDDARTRGAVDTEAAFYLHYKLGLEMADEMYEAIQAKLVDVEDNAQLSVADVKALLEDTLPQDYTDLNIVQRMGKHITPEMVSRVQDTLNVSKEVAEDLLASIHEEVRRNWDLDTDDLERSIEAYRTRLTDQISDALHSEDVPDIVETAAAVVEETIAQVRDDFKAAAEGKGNIATAGMKGVVNAVTGVFDKALRGLGERIAAERNPFGYQSPSGRGSSGLRAGLRSIPRHFAQTASVRQTLQRAIETWRKTSQELQATRDIIRAEDRRPRRKWNFWSSTKHVYDLTAAWGESTEKIIREVIQAAGETPTTARTREVYSQLWDNLGPSNASKLLSQIRDLRFHVAAQTELEKALSLLTDSAGAPISLAEQTLIAPQVLIAAEELKRFLNEGERGGARGRVDVRADSRILGYINTYISNAATHRDARWGSRSQNSVALALTRILAEDAVKNHEVFKAFESLFEARQQTPGSESWTWMFGNLNNYLNEYDNIRGSVETRTVRPAVAKFEEFARIVRNTEAYKDYKMFEQDMQGMTSLQDFLQLWHDIYKEFSTTNTSVSVDSDVMQDFTKALLADFDNFVTVVMEGNGNVHRQFRELNTYMKEMHTTLNEDFVGNFAKAVDALAGKEAASTAAPLVDFLFAAEPALLRSLWETLFEPQRMRGKTRLTPKKGKMSQREVQVALRKKNVEDWPPELQLAIVRGYMVQSILERLETPVARTVSTREGIQTAERNRNPYQLKQWLEKNIGDEKGVILFGPEIWGALKSMKLSSHTSQWLDEIISGHKSLAVLRPFKWMVEWSRGASGEFPWRRKLTNMRNVPDATIAEIIRAVGTRLLNTSPVTRQAARKTERAKDNPPPRPVFNIEPSLDFLQQPIRQQPMR